jgi:Pvc16 N-terminal domain
MLDIVLKFLTSELNTYLSTRMTSTPEEVVRMSKLVDDSGKYAFENSIIASIINIEEDRIFKSQTPNHVYTNGQHILLEPEIKLNLHVIFAANFDIKNYDQALKFISFVLFFFQAHSAFTSAEFPTLDQSIEKLTIELQSLSYEQLNQVWAFIGAKQLPSVIYKVRMVSLQSTVPSAIQPPIMDIFTNIHIQ